MSYIAATVFLKKIRFPPGTETTKKKHFLLITEIHYITIERQMYRAERTRERTDFWLVSHFRVQLQCGQIFKVGRNCKSIRVCFAKIKSSSFWVLTKTSIFYCTFSCTFHYLFILIHHKYEKLMDDFKNAGKKWPFRVLHLLLNNWLENWDKNCWLVVFWSSIPFNKSHLKLCLILVLERFNSVLKRVSFDSFQKRQYSTLNHSKPTVATTARLVSWN